MEQESRPDKPLLLGIDVGTTSCKVSAFDLRGRVVAQASHQYPTYYPQPGWAEQRAQEWIVALEAALQVLGAQLGPQARRLAGAALSAHGPTLVLADEMGNALTPSPTWQDHRSLPQGERLLKSELGPRWIGMGPPKTGFVAKLLWAKENWPDLFAKCAWAGGVKVHVGYWLTGKLGTDPSSGPGDDVWPAEVFAQIGFPVEKLPLVHSPTGLLGHLRPEVARRCGLPSGLPVNMGLNDGASSTLGSGAIHPGDACISLGTNGVGRLIIDHPFDPEVALLMDAFFWPYVSGRWVVGGMTLAGGSCLSWLREVLGQEYPSLLEEASKSPPGCNGVIFLPYLMGRGTPLPVSTARGAFLNLTLSTGTGDMVRAVLEGVAFAIKDIFLGFAEVRYKLERIYITGGGARNALWRQIVAEVLGCPLTWAPGDATLGAAILASVGAGLYADIETAVAAMVHTAETIEPEAVRVRAYEDVYPLYRELGKRLGYVPRS